MTLRIDKKPNYPQKLLFGVHNRLKNSLARTFEINNIVSVNVVSYGKMLDDFFKLNQQFALRWHAVSTGCFTSNSWHGLATESSRSNTIRLFSTELFEEKYLRQVTNCDSSSKREHQEYNCWNRSVFTQKRYGNIL